MYNQESEIQSNISLALEDFGGYVELNRKRRGLSFERLAEKTNLSASFIFRLENKYRDCSLSNKIIILLDGFVWSHENVLRYLDAVIKDRTSLKRITG